MATKRVLFAALLCLGASPALAGQLPNFTPERDFSGIYLISQSDGPKTAQVAYSAAARAARIDVADNPGYILINFASQDFKMVMPAQHAYMDMASLAAQSRLLMGPSRAGGAAPADAPPSAPPDIQNLGTETFAGRSCHLTKVTDTTNGSWTEICATDGGIILHIHTDKGDDITAQSISEAAVAPADVEIPPGYTPFVMPGLPAGIQLPGGMQLPPGVQLPPGMSMPGNPPGQ